MVIEVASSSDICWLSDICVVSKLDRKARSLFRPRTRMTKGRKDTFPRPRGAVTGSDHRSSTSGWGKVLRTLGTSRWVWVPHLVMTKQRGAWPTAFVILVTPPAHCDPKWLTAPP